MNQGGRRGHQPHATLECRLFLSTGWWLGERRVRLPGGLQNQSVAKKAARAFRVRRLRVQHAPWQCPPRAANFRKRLRRSRWCISRRCPRALSGAARRSRAGTVQKGGAAGGHYLNASLGLSGCPPLEAILRKRCSDCEKRETEIYKTNPICRDRKLSSCAPSQRRDQRQPAYRAVRLRQGIGQSDRAPNGRARARSFRG
jgi:hypothetical protein